FSNFFFSRDLSQNHIQALVFDSALSRDHSHVRKAKRHTLRTYEVIPAVLLETDIALHCVVRTYKHPAYCAFVFCGLVAGAALRWSLAGVPELVEDLAHHRPLSGMYGSTAGIAGSTWITSASLAQRWYWRMPYSTECPDAVKTVTSPWATRPIVKSCLHLRIASRGIGSVSGSRESFGASGWTRADARSQSVSSVSRS